MASLQNKVIIITGASAGIGEGIAIHLSTYKPRLVLAARTLSRLEETKDKCAENGLDKSSILTVACDVSKDEDLRHLVETTIKTFGQIDGLVNNAGIGVYGDIASTKTTEYDELMRVNVRAPFFLSQLCIPHLKTTQGSVVNISSILAQHGVKSAAAYCMSKASLDHFTHLLAAELAPFKVNVNTVSAGLTRSEFHIRAGMPENAMKSLEERQGSRIPLGRIGEPVDVAKAVKFLLSDEADFITGEIICVDGGRNNPVFTS